MYLIIYVGVIVEYEGSEVAAKDVAMHIAANKPIGMNSKDVPESVIAAERYVMKMNMEMKMKMKMKMKKNDFSIRRVKCDAHNFFYTLENNNLCYIDTYPR